MSVNLEALEALRRENAALRNRLEEAEAIVRAIRRNEVDAFVVQHEGRDQVLVLDGVDRPYRLLIERMHQGAAVLGRQESIIYVNRRLAELLGTPGPTLAGKPFADYLVEGDQASFPELLRRGTDGDVEQEVTIRRNDGTTVPVLLSLSSLIEPEGFLCLIVTDLTQQKKHEVQRQALLQEQSGRAAAEQIAAALRTADRRKDEFLATLGHELRNPLAPLQNGLHVLGIRTSGDPVLRPTLDMMSRQLESLIRLVNDLLDVGRVTQGKIALQMERTDLRFAITRAVESCRMLLNQHGHSLQVSVPETPVAVEIDLVRITQVVTNLLNNAAKFTPRAGTIWLGLQPDDESGQAVIRVRDTGKGIASEMLNTVFDLFAQADPSVARSEGGLGIGLTLSRRLVEMHGGSLEATSPGIGKGSEFIVRLPLAPAALEPPRTVGDEPNSSSQRTPSRRIVVVDDNRDSAESLAVLLELHGHEVRRAHDGRQALDLLDEFVPQLLLLDIGMPGMDGYEVARQVRSDPRFQGIRIVALSGYGGEQERKRSLAAGFDDHIVKPVDSATLQRLFESL